MSLIDTFFSEPIPGDVWIALRPPSCRGSGSENDPFNGATLDNVSSRLAVTFTTNGTVVVTGTTTLAHGYRNGDIILVEGFAIDTLYMLLGAFVITVTGSNTFTLTTFFAAPPTGPHTGGTCRLDPYLFDAVMRAIPHNAGIRVRLGPGTFETKGYTDSMGGADGVQPLASWNPWSGLKLSGSGMAVTTLRLVQACYPNRPYSVIGCPSMSWVFPPVTGVEITDLLADANIAGQVNSRLTTAGIFIRGSYTRVRRVRVINSGRQGDPIPATQECFPIAVAASEYLTNPADGERVNCVVEDCIVDQPGLRNVRETTCIHLFMDETATDSTQLGGRVDGFTAFHRSCVVRNCYINCEYVENPLSVDSVTVPASGISTVTTRGPHGLSVGSWFRIHGAYDGGYDNGYTGSFKVEQVIGGAGSTQFTYRPADPLPTQPPMAGSQIWLGRFPSQRVAVASGGSSMVLAQISSTPNVWQLTVSTKTAHYLVPGSTVVVLNTLPVAPNDPITPNDTVNDVWIVVATGAGLARRAFVCQRTYAPGVTVRPITDFSVAAFGVNFQGVAIDGGSDAVMEGNQISNCRAGGPYHDTFTSGSWVVRNNHYRAVFNAVHQNMGANTGYRNFPQVYAGALTHSGVVATFTVHNVGGTPGTFVPHGLVKGQAIEISLVTIPQYNGVFVVTSVNPDTNSFTYEMLTTPSGDPVWTTSPPRVLSLWFTRDCVIERNVVELLPSQDSSLLLGTAINIFASLAPPFHLGDFAVFGNAVVRDNIVRYLSGPNGDPITGSSSLDAAVRLAFVGKGLVENNLVDLANPKPLTNYRCGAVSCFNNRTASGNLIRGADQILPSNALILKNELSTVVSDAATLGFL